MTTRTQGRRGEDLAARWLEEQGYTLLDRNYSCRWGELDLVAECTDGGERLIAFTEVKLRRDGDFAPAYAAVTESKTSRCGSTSLKFTPRRASCGTSQTLLNDPGKEHPWPSM